VSRRASVHKFNRAYPLPGQIPQLEISGSLAISSCEVESFPPDFPVVTVLQAATTLVHDLAGSSQVAPHPPGSSFQMEQLAAVVQGTDSENQDDYMQCSSPPNQEEDDLRVQDIGHTLDERTSPHTSEVSSHSAGMSPLAAEGMLDTGSFDQLNFSSGAEIRAYQFPRGPLVAVEAEHTGTSDIRMRDADTTPVTRRYYADSTMDAASVEVTRRELLPFSPPRSKGDGGRGKQPTTDLTLAGGCSAVGIGTLNPPLTRSKSHKDKVFSYFGTYFPLSHDLD
jgi:hypothetical protein